MFSYIETLSLKKLILILFIIGFLTYFSSFINGFVWDDHHFFEQNINTQALTFKNIKGIFTSNTTAGSGVSSNYYRPFTTFSFAVDHQIWGWNPVAMHVTNTVLHIVNSVLVLILLRILKFEKLSSFLVSLLFLIHPVQTEAVTYLSSRGDILYMLFLTLSLLLFTITLHTRKIKIFSKVIYLDTLFPLLLLFHIGLFLLSILSKEGALTTLPIYAGVLFLFGFNKKIGYKKLHDNYRNHFIIFLLLILVAIIYFLFRLTFLNFGNSLNYAGDESIYGKNVGIRILTFLSTIPVYFRLLIFPQPLYLERSVPIAYSIFNVQVLLGLTIVISGLLLGIWEVLKTRTGWILFGMIVIFSNLLSVSGIIPQTGLIRENWLYMPIIGVYIIIFTIFKIIFYSEYRFYKKSVNSKSEIRNPKSIKPWNLGVLDFVSKFDIRHSSLFIRFFSILFIVYCLFLSVMTMQQNYNWRNDISYFEHNLKFADTPRLHLNLGNAYKEKGDLKKSLYHLRKAIALGDYYPQTHHNLARIYVLQGKLDAAEKELLHSLAIDPNYLYAYSGLVSIYDVQKRPEMTLPYLKRLTLIYPDDVKLILIYGEHLYAAGKYSEAELEFAKAIKITHSDPKLLEAINATKKNKTP